MASESKPKKFVFQKGAGAAVTAPAAMTDVLRIIFSHTADTFEGVVDAIADSYGLDRDEMMAVIRSHPKFTEKMLHPVLQDLEPKPVAEKRRFKFNQPSRRRI